MIEKFDFDYTPDGTSRRIHLYLPDEYPTSSERYPVVYMFDGHNLFYNEDATFGKSWGLKEFLDRWDKKVIIVGMECSHVDNQRLTEYCPYNIVTRMAGPIQGAGRETMEWIIGELKPYIDSTYRTWWHREATAIAGSSMGGMMALYAIIRYNGTFSKAAAISPAFFTALKDFMQELRNSPIDPDTRLFMSWGEKEDTSGNQERNILRMEQECTKRNINTQIMCQQQGRHNESSWEKLVPIWMDVLWK